MNLELVEALHTPEGLREPRLEVHHARKHVREEVVQQSPELVEAVLYRRTGEQQAHAAPQLGHGPVQHGLRVLQAVTLVNDNDLPLVLGQPVVSVHLLVVRDADGRQTLCSVAPQNGQLGLAVLHVASEDVDAEARCEPLKLGLPVREGRLRRHHEMRPWIGLALLQVQQERDGLDGLAQAHLVRKNAVQTVRVQRGEPLQTLCLVGHKLGAELLGSLCLRILLRMH
mmetsp:Transcript_21111/g.66715  ORF Transcript_21111/g.66715 Transcript_21111/m.66715 type:complete len:227 (-) Transcript_21111:328-1008(-)